MIDGQISMLNDFHKDWKEEIQSICEELVVANDLLPGSIGFIDNMGKRGKTDKRDQVISRSICFFEPDYPSQSDNDTTATKSNSVMNVKTTDSRFEVTVHESVVKELGCIPGMDDKGPVPRTRFHKFTFSTEALDDVLGNWLEYIKQDVEFELKNYSTRAESFGCCSRFQECSDSGKCVHPNKLYACACAYKRHLENKQIFYGENRNIE